MNVVPSDNLRIELTVQATYSYWDGVSWLGRQVVLIVTCPFRYVGGKFVSILELIIRLGILLKKFILGEEIGSWKKELFETGYSFQAEALPQEQIPEALQFARLYAVAHKIQPDLSNKKECSEWLPAKMQTAGLAVYIQDEVKMVVFHECDTKYVVFGAIGAKGIEEYEGRSIGLGAANLLGYTPSIYHKALQLFEEHKNEMGEKVIFSGQCAGGSLAAFVALKTGNEAYCLNTLPFGVGVQWELGRSLLQKAQETITHICVEGDLISSPSFPFSGVDLALNFIGIRTPTNFGKRYVVPHPPEYNWNIDSIHRLIIGSLIYQHSGQQKVFGRESLPGAQNYLREVVDTLNKDFASVALPLLDGAACFCTPVCQICAMTPPT